ncbi:hypothetical protein V2J09_021666 [Rumex salicifolius]
MSAALPPQSSCDPPPPRRLLKQSTWSPDLYREEAWVRRKGRANRRSKSVTEEDLDELKACFELGFGFDSPDLDPKLSDAFPAYGLYHAVNNQYSKSSSDLPSPIFSPGEDPKTMKTRLRQWAQVVACSVKHSSI